MLTKKKALKKTTDKAETFESFFTGLKVKQIQKLSLD